MSWAKGFKILCLFGALSLSMTGQKPAEHFRPPAQSNAPKNPNSGNKGGVQPNKMGQWLQNHKNLPPDQQEKLLESDPNFKKLPPERQQQLRDRLRKFNSLPPEQRERALNRMQFIANLSKDQRQQIREANQVLQTLPQDRQILLHKAIRHLSQMTPQEREQAMSEDRFKNMFSEQERGILSKLSAINPPPGGAANPKESDPQGSGTQAPK